ncbi:acetylxylan esterase [Lacibacter sp.]|uniref:acetylxylan esterase n=1 Tax=Lacibacter sp. TaxID=1915409 RepID=UPI002B4AE339|nr:acetylxylan esterase [Lacibacter sp.]HLP36042.1 acetylxylan esterase [Lacibacter sp.]
MMKRMQKAFLSRTSVWMFTAVILSLNVAKAKTPRHTSETAAVQRIDKPAAAEAVVVKVTADHSDWLYKINEKVVFKISVLQDGKPMKGAKLSYEIGPEKMPPVQTGEVQLIGSDLVLDGGAMQTGGFLRCTATVEYEGKKYKGMATAAISPETIQPTTVMPNDFMEFWTKAIEENKKIPMDLRMELQPQLSNDKVNVYQVNMQNHKIGMRLYGMLSMPKAPGKYPAVLRVPGAGVRPYKGDVKLAEKGIVVFEIGIHGIPVNLDSMVYENLRFGALLGYPTFNLDNRDEYYYKRVYLGCLRSVDLIFSLPEFDGSNMIVMGGSQGGALALVTAALDKRVKTILCTHPALSDLTGYQIGRAGGWPHMFAKKEHLTKEKIETSRYYDAVNFARLISIPGFYSLGYNDETTPPTSLYATFNSIKAPKTFFIDKETGHAVTQAQRNKQIEFILKTLKLN